MLALLAIAGEARDALAVLSNRFSLSKRTIHLALIAEGMRHERTAATLGNGMANQLTMARGAETAIRKGSF